MDTFNILQYNMKKSRNIIMIPLFQNNNILDINVIALQKPWKNIQDQTTYHPYKNAFYFLCPKATWQKSINKKIE